MTELLTELLTAAQMRAIEQAAIDSGEVTGLELMERAGRGVVEAVFQEWPELAKSSHRAVVLCGPGNNGGDGFVVARLLKEWGWEVNVFLYGDPGKLPPDARVNYERWVEMGEVEDFSRLTLGSTRLPDLFIDAVFGTGLTRRIEGFLAQVLGSLDSFRTIENVRTVAVDIPSGLCADSGRHLGTFATADLTVSFHSAKLGHYQSRGSLQAGKIIVKAIGLAAGGRPAVPPGETVQLIARPDGRLRKTTGSHKYIHGHALILSGGPAKTGAARLAARGALRIGAGLVTLGVPGAAQMEVASQSTAIMLRRAGDADELAEVLEDDRINALCLGPGLGLDARAAGIVATALEQSGPDRDKDRFVVLDADALTLVSGDGALFSGLHAHCVITPHAGEFAHLFPDIAERLNAPATKGPAYSKVDATREAAARAGCVVLFKGPDTVIAAPDGRCSINSAHYDRAAPWLATAGSGDVLAGFIAGLLARGFAPVQAAETAAWLHVECALGFGPGLIAEDLPEELPAVFRALGV